MHPDWRAFRRVLLDGLIIPWAAIVTSTETEAASCFIAYHAPTIGGELGFSQTQALCRYC
jgi:hypothetical protein